jgi:hypothetical protein
MIGLGMISIGNLKQKMSGKVESLLLYGFIMFLK